MTDTTLRPPTIFAPVARVWTRVSPSLVPILAVITALIITVPFMIATGAEGDFGRGLNIAGTAYSALIEGSIGVAVNDIASHDDFDQLLALSRAEGGDLTRTELRQLARGADRLVALGADNVEQYAVLLALFPDVSEDDLTALAESLPDIRTIGAEQLAALQPLLTAFDALERDQVNALTTELLIAEELPADRRAAVEALYPDAAALSDADLLRELQLVAEYGFVRVTRLSERAAVLTASGATDEQLDLLATLPTVAGGIGAVQEAAAVIERFDAAGILNPTALAEQIGVLREMYSADLLTNDDVEAAIQTEFDTALADNLVVRRPGNRLVTTATSAASGVIYGDNNTSDDASDDVPDTVFLRLGGAALLFFPENLEIMLVRAIPFVIAGLAVALGFKAGLFNIGAEGQLYAGGVFAVWVGFSPIFDFLPLPLRLALVLAVGILGGALWGALPGALKAYTGAHEVITTIMLNYIAIVITGWLVSQGSRSQGIAPGPLRDPNPANIVPRTAKVLEEARLPALFSLGDETIHAGLILAILAVIAIAFIVWRTTFGFEVRTVGQNPSAARYAGINVPRVTILTMALAGGLAGLAGSVETLGRNFYFAPNFNVGYGFDSIAIALLGGNHPVGVGLAAVLFGGMDAGGTDMQFASRVPTEILQVVQALVLMFVAAPAILRYLFRLRVRSEDTTTFSAGWGKR